MSGECKKTKADLGGLFKLEFYRKQKNWKLCSEVHKKDRKDTANDKLDKLRQTKSSKNKLNKTYDVEPAENMEKSVLNEAFMESDDKNFLTPPVSPKTPKTDSQKSDIASERLGKNPDGFTPDRPDFTPDRPEFTPEIPDFTSAQDNPRALTPPEPMSDNCGDWKETQVLDMAQNIPWSAPEIGLEDYQCTLPETHKFGFEGGEPCWPRESQVWLNHRMFSKTVWSEDVMHELEQLNVVQDTAPDVPDGAQPDGVLQNKEGGDVLSSRVLSFSLTEEHFLREAHCVPHSTEIEMQPQLDSLENIASSLDSLPEAALVDKCRSYMRALTRVQAELRARERIKGEFERHQRSRMSGHSTFQTQYDFSYEEYPTRDVGLTQPIFSDTFLAGSHMNNPNDDTLYRVQGRSQEVNQGHPSELIQGHPSELIQDHPNEVFQSHPSEVFQGHPSEVIKCHPSEIIQGHSIEVFQRHPSEVFQGHPSEVFQSHPSEVFQGHLSEVIQGHPSGYLREPMQGHPQGQLSEIMSQIPQRGQVVFDWGPICVERGQPDHMWFQGQAYDCQVGRGRGRLRPKDNVLGSGKGRGRT